MKKAPKKGESENGKDWSGVQSRYQREKLIGIN